MRSVFPATLLVRLASTHFPLLVLLATMAQLDLRPAAYKSVLLLILKSTEFAFLVLQAAISARAMENLNARAALRISFLKMEDAILNVLGFKRRIMSQTCVILLLVARRTTTSSTSIVLTVTLPAINAQGHPALSALPAIQGSTNIFRNQRMCA